MKTVQVREIQILSAIANQIFYSRHAVLRTFRRATMPHRHKYVCPTDEGPEFR